MDCGVRILRILQYFSKPVIFIPGWSECCSQVVGMGLGEADGEGFLSGHQLPSLCLYLRPPSSPDVHPGGIPQAPQTWQEVQGLPGAGRGCISGTDDAASHSVLQVALPCPSGLAPSGEGWREGALYDGAGIGDLLYSLPVLLPCLLPVQAPEVVGSLPTPTAARPSESEDCKFPGLHVTFDLISPV